MVKVKRFFVVLCALIVFFFSSCSEVVRTTTDEIRLNSWQLKTEYGNNVTLNFDDDIGELNVESYNKDSSVTVKGLCVIDDTNIVIFDHTDKQTYMFTYILSGNQLTLGYDGGQITLTRK